MWNFVLCAVAFVYFFEDNFVEAKKFALAADDIFAKIKEKPSDRKEKVEELLEQTTLSSTLELDVTLPDEYANDTIKVDYHKYYNSTFYGSPYGKPFWIDLDKMNQEHVITSEMLSNSYRQATSISLSFAFPFYGSEINNVTVATGGFLYMGEYIHNWIAATQYIAPLMANFDTSLSLNSTIKYADNGTVFIVQWDKVHVSVQERSDYEPFTFQVVLFKNGDISFAYKNIPFEISELSDEIHPVKVGVSDAYILERQVFFIRRKTIYEYHRADFKKNRISNDTAIVLKALPTCPSFKDCHSCVSANADLECHWCSTVQRCSDGIDRQRQSWIVSGCSLERPTSACSTPSTDDVVPFEKVADASSTQTPERTRPTEKSGRKGENVPQTTVSHSNDLDYGYGNGSYYIKQNSVVSQYIQEEERESNSRISGKSGSSIGIGTIISIVIFIIAITAVGAWMFYAYRFPQSSSGQFLIRYRPSQWRLKPAEPSSNADMFHM